MGDWLQRNIVEPGKLPLLLALTVVRAHLPDHPGHHPPHPGGQGPVRQHQPGGMHIHHVVPGVVLTVVGGFGAVAAAGTASGRAPSRWSSASATGLVLDEFALILHLDDVYWTEAGRKSVEVVVLTAALVGAGAASASRRSASTRSARTSCRTVGACHREGRRSTSSSRWSR